MKIYLIIGILLLIFTSLEIFWERFRNEYSKNLFYLLAILIGLIFMTRWFVGWDWYNYYAHFRGGEQDFEKGYVFLVELTRKLTEDYQIFVAFNTLVDFILLFWVIPKYSKYPLTTLMLYLGVNGLSLEVDIMRNAKSILFFLVSLKFLEKREIILYMGLNIIGCFFHISSIIYIPLYFILPVTYKKRLILGIFILGNIYYFSEFNFFRTFFQYIPFERLQGYLNFTESGRGVLNFFYLERIVIFLFALTTSEIIDRKKIKIYGIIQNSIYLSVYIFLYLRELPVISLRFFLLFSYGYWLVFPLFLDGAELRLKKNIYFKIAVFLIAGSIATFRTYNFLTFQGNQIVYPYENYFFNKTPRDEKIKALKEGVKYREDGIGREILLLY